MGDQLSDTVLGIIMFFVLGSKAGSRHATSRGLTGGGLIAAIIKSLWEIGNNEHEICSLPRPIH